MVGTDIVPLDQTTGTLPDAVSGGTAIEKKNQIILNRIIFNN